jgi:glycosyltransferase involved in cell wall biosynthesis
MSSLIENRAPESLLKSVAVDARASQTFSAPVFLMVNSLETGGTERQFVEVARILRADRVPVHLGCIKKEGAFLDDVADADEFRLGGSLYGLKSMRTRWRLSRHLRKLNITVAHSFDFYTNLTMIPAARLARVPVVIGSHRQIGDLLTPSQFRVQLAAFRMCDRVVCNSHSAAESLLRAGLPEQKVIVIGNALPSEAFSGSAPALSPPDGVLLVGMIARMNAAYKNHSAFLREAARLAPRFPQIEFVLAGDGPMRIELERQAADLGIANRVHFLGDRRDISAVLASLDISVVPSTSESLSNVMLESMAAGVPVVAAAVGGNIELGGEGRAILISTNERAIGEGIARLVQDKALASAMALSARTFVRSVCSAERIGQQYQDLYRSVLVEKTERAAPRREAQVSRSARSAIRVALVAPTLRYVGGQAVQADLLLQKWKDDREADVSFIAVDPRLPFVLRWTEKVPVLRTLLRSPLYAWALWRGLKDADVAHIFSASYSSFLLAPLPAWCVARMLGKKTLINYRSGEARDHLQRSWIARRVLRNTDRIVVPSGYLVEVFRDFGLQAQAVPNIVDLSQFRYRVRQPLRPHLICTRGFHPYYGIDVLVRAFAEVQKVYPDAQLDLVGGGPLEASIREIVQTLELIGVNFLGVASRHEIGSLYERADIFVNASNLDNMPVSVLEAFAAGTPVVSTSPDGMDYIVTHERTGLLSSVGDSAALANNILRMLNNPELAEELARNAFAESQRFCWKAVRHQWLGVYSGLSSPSGKEQ